ncbi:hypothetical protein CR513_39363, partial [Mucuna pruriens]
MLRGVTMRWFLGLPSRSIHTFNDSAVAFVSQFATNWVKRLKVANLFNIRQIKSKSLKQYLACFNSATVLVDVLDQKFFVKEFQKGLRTGSFSDSLALRKLVSMGEIRARAKKLIKVEEDLANQL